MRSVKVSESVYQKLKEISANDKLTMSEVVEKLLSTIPLQPCGRSGGNQDQESNSTFYRIPVENHGGAVESGKVESGGRKVEYVTKQEFLDTVERMWSLICNWTQELLQSLKEKVGIDLLNDAQEDQEEDEGLECSREEQEED